MQLIEQKKEEYKAWFDKNDDPYSRRCFTYAEQWAELMEQEMATGKRLEDVAKECSHIADTDGITGFMYGAACSILSKVWVHGEQLRRWHNIETCGPERGAEVNEKPGATVNPAILTIG